MRHFLQYLKVEQADYLRGTPLNHVASAQYKKIHLAHGDWEAMSLLPQFPRLRLACEAKLSRGFRCLIKSPWNPRRRSGRARLQNRREVDYLLIVQNLRPNPPTIGDSGTQGNQH
jgi:hypothetical protein